MAQEQAEPSGRWVPVCQECWQGLWPDQYCPELTGYNDCYWCGEFSTLTVNVNPKDLPAPVERDTIEVYGTPEHEAWLVYMERVEG